LIQTLVPASSLASAEALPAWALQLAAIVIVAYIALLPVVYTGLTYNFYFRRRLPAPWQAALERYTNFFGITLWRVFSADLVNFVIEVQTEPKAGGARVTLSDYRNALFHRFAHVCEMIAITSVFTTLKYYPGNTVLFQERLMRYARTLPCLPTDVLVFAYKSIQETETGFVQTAIAEFLVDPRMGTVAERAIDPSGSVRAPTEHSPVHEGARPGSYAPPA
jgi:hypothetical protein